MAIHPVEIRTDVKYDVKYVLRFTEGGVQEAQPPELVVPLDAEGEVAWEQYDHTEGDNYKPQAARSSAPRL